MHHTLSASGPLHVLLLLTGILLSFPIVSHRIATSMLPSEFRSVLSPGTPSLSLVSPYNVL